MATLEERATAAGTFQTPSQYMTGAVALGNIVIDFQSDSSLNA